MMHSVFNQMLAGGGEHHILRSHSSQMNEKRIEDNDRGGEDRLNIFKPRDRDTHRMWIYSIGCAATRRTIDSIVKKPMHELK